jgi:D-sedoheptulose 7-phosphate isomerase
VNHAIEDSVVAVSASVASGWERYVESYRVALGGLSVTDEVAEPIERDEGLSRWVACALAVRRTRGTVYLIGNGASASMASHVAADLAKNGRLHTQVFSDLSLITAVSNDLGYEHVFAEPLRDRGQAGDMLVAISSSGRSPNLLRATDVARELRMHVVTLTAMAADNPLRRAGWLNLHVPAAEYGLAESCHAAILHRWIDLVQEAT